MSGIMSGIIKGIMRSGEDIMKDVVKFKDTPDGYNLVEIQCFNALKQILVMYNRGEISKEAASKNKLRIYSEYEKEAKDFIFKDDIYNLHIENIKKTENNRIKLHKLLADKDRKIAENDLTETIRVCLDIIDTVFPGEFPGEFNN
jgi:hypothetical protein